MEEPEDLLFSNAELHAILSKALGLDASPLPTGDRPHPDPGTITSTELREDYGLSRSATDRTLSDLKESGIITPDWIKRYDPWPPHKTKKIKGYRLCKKEEGDANAPV